MVRPLVVGCFRTRKRNIHTRLKGLKKSSLDFLRTALGRR
jgi:hypothetical protein